ncbi:colorectal cancer associated 2 [Polymixia lowei]
MEGKILKLIYPQLYYNIVVCSDAVLRHLWCTFLRLLQKFRSWPFTKPEKDVVESHRSSSKSRSLHPANMSDKPKVYQGVRVKTTVKELLQRQRAREADFKKTKPTFQSRADMQKLCGTTFPITPPTGHCVDTTVQAADALFHADAAYSNQTQESVFDHRQFLDVVLPGDSYSSCPPPPPSLALPWSHGHLSSDADYYSHVMAPPSPPDSLKLPSPVDHNSYSPQDSFSSSSSSCYNSPTRMDSSYHGFTQEHYHYQHCNLQDCYCLSHCWPGQQDGFSAPEYAPYYSPTDYSYTYPVEDTYFKRDLPISSEMCYNVL